MTRLAIILLVLVAGTSQVVADGPFPTKELVEIAARHKLPMPPKEARLVLAHTESWTLLGSRSTSRSAGIYAPAFLLAEKDGETTILRGTKKVVLSRRGREPLSRPFSMEPVDPKVVDYVMRFNTLDDFVCAVQLASRGDEKVAQGIWERFASADFRTELVFGEAVPQKPDSPTTLLAACIFDHLFREVLRSPADWPEIKDRVEKLFAEFPVLKTKERTTLLDSLAASVKAKLPDAKSTEALLLDWSRRPGELRHLGLFADNNDKVNGPAREIVLRGFDAVPDLISLISDQRITVHIDPRGGRDTILRFGELALTLLAEISGKQVAEVESWDAWWAKARLLKEEEFFAEAAFLLEEGKITWVNSGPVRILGRKYPARLTLLCEEFSKRGFSETQPFSLAEAVAESPQPLDKRVQILAEFALRGSLAHKRSVLQVLAKLDGEKCSKLLTPILKTLPTDSKKSYWTCEEAAFTHVVMQIEDDDIWREYLRAAKRSSIGLRMEMMNPMNYTYIGGKNRQRRLAFLAAFLDDAAVRDKATDPEEFGGPSAGFAIPKITVRDFAANKMASILDLGDDLDTVSAAAEWEKLRERVRAKLAAEMLPDLTGK